MGDTPPRLSSLDDPPCPECGHALFTERAAGRDGGAWWCVRHHVAFDPPRSHRGNR